MDTHELIGFDWKGHPIWSDDGDEYFETPQGYVLNDSNELKQYMISQFGSATQTYQIYKEVTT